MSVLIGDKALVHLLLFSFIAFPYFCMPANQRRAIFISIIFAGIAICAIFLWHMNFPALAPVPEIIVIIISWFMILITIATIGISALFMWSQTNAAEKIILQERQKSENLLLNILPEAVVRELKEQGRAKPVKYRDASVLFTDFVGFTKIAENLEADSLIKELDLCFSYFDSVTRRYNLEKIKTIGDSYMLAGGIPRANFTHAIDCVLAALEIQAFMNQMREIKSLQNLPYWELRLGIHSGTLVAGVIGEMKFAYDIFGDTVNLARRMDSSGIPGKINISREIHEKVKHLFVTTYRGQVQAKNKGLMDMYFLEGIKPKFSVDGNGRVPNNRFKAIYSRIAAGAKLISK